MIFILLSYFPGTGHISCFKSHSPVTCGKGAVMDNLKVSYDAHYELTFANIVYLIHAYVKDDALIVEVRQGRRVKRCSLPAR